MSAAVPGEPLWATGRWTWFATPDRRLLVLSIVVQIVLALFFGHSFDTRIFMATGYLVGTGHDPYVSQHLGAVFHHVGLDASTTVGYPPPWPLVLGLLYRAVHAVTSHFLIYNLALKLPVIAADVGVAYLAAATLQNLGARPEVCRRAWLFLLFNPFVLYVGAAWGQIDAIVALLSLAALVLLYAKRLAGSAVLLALGVCVKPTALPIALVALVYLLSRSPRRAVGYAAGLCAGVLLIGVVPFLALGWDATPVLSHLNAHFTMSGAMSFMTVVRLQRDPLLMQGHWWLLGLLWIPALAVATLALRRGVGGLQDLVRKSTALVLVFYLTRSWLSEPNVVLVIPLLLILVSLGDLDRRALTAVWVIPFVFTLFNASPLQLLWVAFPQTMERSLAFVGGFPVATLVARAALVVAWQLAGWWIVIACLRRRPAREATGA